MPTGFLLKIGKLMPMPLEYFRPNWNCSRKYLVPSVYIYIYQCCGAKNIFFGSGSTEPQIRLQVQIVFIRYRYLENYLFDLSNSNHLQKLLQQPWFLSFKFLQVCSKSKRAGAAICNFGSGSGRQFNFGSSALSSGSATLQYMICFIHLDQIVDFLSSFRHFNSLKIKNQSWMKPSMTTICYITWRVPFPHLHCTYYRQSG